MSQLIQLKQRIKTITAVKKITQTMRLIARSMHSKLKKQAGSLQVLKQEFKPLLCTLTKQKVVAQGNGQKIKYKTLFIICASEKGLCGTFNATMFSYFNKKLTPETLQNSHVISVGKKASQYITQRGIVPIVEFNKILPNKLESIVQDIYTKIVEIYPDYEEVVCLSSFAKTFFTQEPQTTTLIPIKQYPCSIIDENINFLCSDVVSSYKQFHMKVYGIKIFIHSTILKKSLMIFGIVDDYEWPQDKQDVTNSLFQILLRVNILSILINSMLSEQSSRFLSMDNATRSAQDLQKSLKLAFNKMRQAKITRELIELISGFN